MTGPLHGVRVVELAGIGPGPFAAMLLADMGADVVRVDRVDPPSPDYTPNAVLERGRRSVAVDLRRPEGAAIVRRLASGADVLVESNRPGVLERLGLGPDVLLADNPRLVIGRLTGHGQDGPLAGAVGHDLNYISLTGALHTIGRAGEPPPPPLNLVGDFGGAGSALAFGVVCALWEARGSGVGQVVDANALESTAALMGLVHGLRAAGRWSLDRGANLLDGGTPYYDTYTCADGRWVAVATVEEKFFLELLRGLELDGDADLVGAHKDRSRWPALRSALTAAFARRSRDEWAAHFASLDACVTPVLDLDEAAVHPHAVARGGYVATEGTAYPQPAVSPRFSRSTTPVPGGPARPGEHTRAVLTEAGYAAAQVAELLAAGVARQA